jgi:hypothetical protein
MATLMLTVMVGNGGDFVNTGLFVLNLVCECSNKIFKNVFIKKY